MTRVVCFGDSIGYYQVLEERLAVETVMGGVGGNSTAQALRRMQRDVLDHHPGIVVIFFGTNDLRVDAPKVYVNPKDYEKNLKMMIQECEKIGAQVIMCTLPPINVDKFFTRHETEPYDKEGGLPEMIATYRDVAIQVAAEQQIPLVDLNQELAKQPEWMSPDGVHPSKEGTGIIGRLIAEKLRPLLPQ